MLLVGSLVLERIKRQLLLFSDNVTGGPQKRTFFVSQSQFSYLGRIISTHRARKWWDPLKGDTRSRIMGMTYDDGLGNWKQRFPQLLSVCLHLPTEFTSIDLCHGSRVESKYRKQSVVLGIKWAQLVCGQRRNEELNWIELPSTLPINPHRTTCDILLLIQLVLCLCRISQPKYRWIRNWLFTPAGSGKYGKSNSEMLFWIFGRNWKSRWRINSSFQNLVQILVGKV